MAKNNYYHPAVCYAQGSVLSTSCEQSLLTLTVTLAVLLTIPTLQIRKLSGEDTGWRVHSKKVTGCRFNSDTVVLGLQPLTTALDLLCDERQVPHWASVFLTVKWNGDES